MGGTKTRVMAAVLVLSLPAVGCASSSGSKKPPGARLAVGPDTVDSEAYTYCWESGGLFGGSGMCMDGAVGGKVKPQVSVERRAEATLTFDGPAPASVEASATLGSIDGSETVLLPASAEDLTFELPLGPGTWYVDVFATWPQGDASYLLPIAVNR